jgi:hypothetical protein
MIGAEKMIGDAVRLQVHIRPSAMAKEGLLYTDERPASLFSGSGTCFAME